MIRALAFACLVLAVSASAQEASRPSSSGGAVRAAEIVGALKTLPAERLGDHPLVQAVINLPLGQPGALTKLAPVVAALGGQPVTAENARAALISASIQATQRAQALEQRYLELGTQAGRADLLAFAGEAERVRAGYSLFLSMQDGAAVHGMALQARERADALKEGELRGSAERTAEELGSSKQTDGVEGAPGAGESSSPLKPAAPRASAGAAELPKPAAPSARPESPTRITLAGAASYLGGALVMVALLLIPGMNAASLGAGGLFVVAVAYGALFTATGAWLRRKGFNAAGGILATAALVSVPVAVYMAETWAGLWATTTSHLGVDALALAVAGSVFPAAVGLARKFKFGFLSMPAAVAAAAVLGILIDALAPGAWLMAHARALCGAYGLGLLGAAAWLDKRWPGPKYGGWLAGMASFILFGALLEWGGTEAARLGVASLYAGLIALGAVIDRRVLAVFGALGVAAYLFHLVGLWSGSALFPLILIAAGLSFIAGAAVFQKKFPALQAWLKARLGR